MKNYCYTCMNEIGEDNFCSHCQRENVVDDTVYRLKPGTVLNGKFLVGNCLGEGGFGITYIGRDLTLDRKVAIKEYFPNGYVNRNNTIDQNITVATEDKRAFVRKGLSNFLEEARNIARLNDVPGIVDVRDYFEENCTAYIIMEYLYGINLSTYLQTKGFFTPENIFTLMLPITYSLQKIHEQGIIHRDISPDNIMYLQNGSLRLTDFGSARFFTDDEKEMSVMLKQGYAPPEQYSRDGEQGPWTDVYSLCATMYRCITGRIPVDAVDRIKQDTLIPPSQLGIRIPEAMEKTLMYGLAVFRGDRCQSMQELSFLMEKALAEQNIRIQSPNIYHRVNQTMIADGDPAYRDDYSGGARTTLYGANGQLPPQNGNVVNRQAPPVNRFNQTPPNGYGRNVPPPAQYRGNAPQNDYRQPIVPKTNHAPVIIAVAIFLCISIIAGAVIFLYIQYGRKSARTIQNVTPTASAAAVSATENDPFAPPPTDSSSSQDPYSPSSPVTPANPMIVSSASASSVLTPMGDKTYGPENVLNKSDTCWCPASGTGIGQWIRINLSQKSTVRGLEIINGYAGSQTQYSNNRKVTWISIEFSDGTTVQKTLQVYEDAQRKTVQTVTFDPVETSYVKITIIGVREADGEDACDDTCITYISPVI